MKGLVTQHATRDPCRGRRRGRSPGHQHTSG